jgi:hypothetical protein
MPTVVAVKPNPKKEGTGFAKLEDGSEAWTPELAKLEPLVGRPLPDGWTLKDGPYGPQLLPPKEKGAGAYRNTRDGFLAEQDFMNRRTALMQAMAQYAVDRQGDAKPGLNIVLRANDLYAWLKDPSTSAGSPPMRAARGDTAGNSSPPPTADKGAASEPLPLPEDDSGVALTSPAAPNAAGTSGGEGRQSGEGGDPNLPTISLWKQLDQYAGSRAKAINAINRVCKTSWTRGNATYIPQEDLELTLHTLLKEEG